jgi:hypothetical protein
MKIDSNSQLRQQIQQLLDSKQIPKLSHQEMIDRSYRIALPTPPNTDSSTAISGQAWHNLPIELLSHKISQSTNFNVTSPEDQALLEQVLPMFLKNATFRANDASSIPPSEVPAIAHKLIAYLAKEQAHTETVPQLLQGFENSTYNSTPINEAPLLFNSEKEYIVASLGTPPEVAQLHQAGIANVLNPEWQAFVQDAITRNGGLGNSEDGFLAFSEDYGFVRLRNPNLTPEQNRELAAMSLELGMPVEKLPSRTSESSATDPKTNNWVDGFIAKHHEQLEKFLADPSQGYKVKDGKRRYQMDFDEKSGRAVSYYYKKASGLRGFVQKNLKGIIKTIDFITGAKFFKKIPIVGEVLNAMNPLSDLKFLAAGIASGKFDWATFGKTKIAQLQTALSVAFPPAAPLIAAGATALNAGIDWASTGKLKFSATDIYNLATNFIPGVGKFLSQNQFLNQALQMGVEAIDTGKVSAQSLWGAIQPHITNSFDILKPNADGTPSAWSNMSDLIAETIDTGKISASELYERIKELTQGTSLEDSVNGIGDFLETLNSKKEVALAA